MSNIWEISTQSLRGNKNRSRFLYYLWNNKIFSRGMNNISSLFSIIFLREEKGKNIFIYILYYIIYYIYIVFILLLYIILYISLDAQSRLHSILAGYYFSWGYNYLTRLEANVISLDRSIPINYIDVILNANANCEGSNRLQYRRLVSKLLGRKAYRAFRRIWRISLAEKTANQITLSLAHDPCTRSIIPARYLSNEEVRLGSLPIFHVRPWYHDHLDDKPRSEK